MSKKGKVRIGISGWQYRGWRGYFYPEKLVQRNELPYAAGIFDSIEINGTFYSLQRPSTFARWADETPDYFLFAIKGPRYIIIFAWLKEVKVPLANFFASGLLRLGPKLGPILWQSPPEFPIQSRRHGSISENVAARFPLSIAGSRAQRSYTRAVMTMKPWMYGLRGWSHGPVAPNLLTGNA